jgi:hypothetical protein
VGPDIPLINVEKTEYGDFTPWAPLATAPARSLQRISRTVHRQRTPPTSVHHAHAGAVNVGQSAITDNDGDGMTNAYEDANGFDKLTAPTGAQDADGDGMTNAAESVAGTDPRNLRQLPARDGRENRRRLPHQLQPRRRAKLHHPVSRQSSGSARGSSSWISPRRAAPATVTRDDLTGVAQRFYRVVTPQQ